MEERIAKRSAGDAYILMLSPGLGWGVQGEPRRGIYAIPTRASGAKMAGGKGYLGPVLTILLGNAETLKAVKAREASQFHESCNASRQCLMTVMR